MNTSIQHFIFVSFLKFFKEGIPSAKMLVFKGPSNQKYKYFVCLKKVVKNLKNNSYLKTKLQISIHQENKKQKCKKATFI